MISLKYAIFAAAFQEAVGYSGAMIAGGMIYLPGVPAVIRGPTARGAGLPGG
jgi:hypothetical protein